LAAVIVLMFRWALGGNLRCDLANRKGSIGLPQNGQRSSSQLSRSRTRATSALHPRLDGFRRHGGIEQSDRRVQAIQISPQAFKPLLGLTDLAGEFGPFC
jgi:hypothetical protein